MEIEQLKSQPTTRYTDTEPSIVELTIKIHGYSFEIEWFEKQFEKLLKYITAKNN